MDTVDDMMDELDRANAALSRGLSLGPDVGTRLEALSTVRSLVDWYELRELARARRYGASWRDLGTALGMSHQGAKSRYDRLAIKCLDAGLQITQDMLDGAE